MNTIVAAAMALLLFNFWALFSAKSDAGKEPLTETSILDFTMKSIDDEDIPLSVFKGKVLLIVNVASRCGHTKQYGGLQKLYDTYRERGFEVLGFPANNFMGQEPGTNAEIKEFCSTQFGVTFPMFGKISVKGNDQHPLYRFLTSEATNPTFAGPVKWNFQKYLVNRDGEIVARFAPGVDPMSVDVVSAVEAAVNKKPRASTD